MTDNESKITKQWDRLRSTIEEMLDGGVGNTQEILNHVLEADTLGASADFCKSTQKFWGHDT